MERNLQKIEIETHEEIQDHQRAGCEEHDICRERTGSEIEIQHIESKQEENREVDQSEEKALFPILFDRVKIIGTEENGVTANQTAQNVGRADILPAEGQREKGDANADADIGSGRIITRNKQLRAEEIEQKIAFRRGCDQIRSIERSKKCGLLGRCGADIRLVS